MNHAICVPSCRCCWLVSVENINLLAQNKTIDIDTFGDLISHTPSHCRFGQRIIYELRRFTNVGV